MDSRDTLVRMILVALLLYSLASLGTVGRELRQAELMLTEMGRQAAELEARNTELENSITQGKSPEEMERLARERLGLVLPGEKLFYFSSTDREG